MDTKIESKAIFLLKQVLLESNVETEFDADIYKFLKSINELPDEYEFYGHSYSDSGENIT